MSLEEKLASLVEHSKSEIMVLTHKLSSLVHGGVAQDIEAAAKLALANIESTHNSLLASLLGSDTSNVITSEVKTEEGEPVWTLKRDGSLITFELRGASVAASSAAEPDTYTAEAYPQAEDRVTRSVLPEPGPIAAPAEPELPKDEASTTDPTADAAEAPPAASEEPSEAPADFKPPAASDAAVEGPSA